MSTTVHDLFTDNIPLAYYKARQSYRRRGPDLDDLRQVALLDLYRAACHYDPARGKPFAALAGVCMHHALFNAQKNWRPLRRLPERRDPVAPKAEYPYAALDAEALLAKLPNRWRQIVRARFGLGVEQRSSAALAKDRGVVPLTIDGHLRRALAYLREEVGAA
jgi:RNA polymerase sigma factor (sigma-70 family)